MFSAFSCSFAPVFLSAVPLVVGAQDQDTSARPTRPPVGIPNQDAGPGDLGGEFFNPSDAPFVTLGLGGSSTVLYQLNLPNRRWKEEFAVVWPDTQAFPPPYPVLTLFHGFAETPLYVVNATELDDRAAERGWLTIIPLGAHVYNYGIDYAQDNIEDVFEFVQQLAPIDPDRIYAIGFSMGGGAAASYAARHLDPNHVRFAAIVNHTGSTSLRDTYQAGGNTTSTIMGSPLMFGGPPAGAPFRYLRSSAIDLKPGNIVDPETDIVRNLMHVPVFHFSASNDPLQYLVTQSYQMHLRLQYWGGTSDWTTVPSSSHSWTTLPTTILDDLESLSLEEPREGLAIPVLADRDGRWHFFELRQARDKRLSPFTFEWSTGLNTLWLSDVENVASLAVELTSAGLSASGTLQVHVQTRTLGPVDVALRGYTAPPSSVMRDLVPTTAWTFDSGTRTVTLREDFGVFGTTWAVTP
jgi:pimeloyl-ACP methyl ester carboxylesterase